jgi:hypothetical protein
MISTGMNPVAVAKLDKGACLLVVVVRVYGFAMLLSVAKPKQD